MAERISKENFSEKVLHSSLPVLVDFYSDSCVACKKLSPVLAEAEENYEGRLSVYKVNTNYDANLAEEYEVTANPTLLFLENGKVKDKKQGALRPAELNAWIEELL